MVSTREEGKGFENSRRDVSNRSSLSMCPVDDRLTSPEVLDLRAAPSDLPRRLLEKVSNDLLLAAFTFQPPSSPLSEPSRFP
jgi:hypothetical protein